MTDSRESRVQMANVGGKPVTSRSARAEGTLTVSQAQASALGDNTLAKGDWRNVARLAGIQGAKHCADLVPLCHPLPLDYVDVDIELDPRANQVRVLCTAMASAKTGVEMEALTGVTAALLAVYDMIKSLDKGATIGPIVLLEKSGGKSGAWSRSNTTPKKKERA
jgi:cyclic pyranopterin phosphate synthase